jgi:hypothetical protein
MQLFYCFLSQFGLSDHRVEKVRQKGLLLEKRKRVFLKSKELKIIENNI